MPLSDSTSPHAFSRRDLLRGRISRARLGQTGQTGQTGQAGPAHTAQADKPPAPVRWLGKASYGYSAAARAAFDALAGNDDARWSAWLDQQLDPGRINDSACQARIASAAYVTLDKSLPQLWADHHENPADYFQRMLPLYETECATLLRATFSKRQLLERMVGFWHDHFNIYGADYDCAPVFVHYDRDVIRPNALGNFRSLLGAVARSTCMLYYLDNYASKGANYNENYARELMELHTLGVDHYYGPNDPFGVPCVSLSGHEIHCPASMPAGYVDNDVYEAAAALTGWSVKNGNWQFPADNDGSFVYRADWHDHRNKFFLGLYLPANQPAMVDGEQILDRLCQHPGTAQHIAGKLCRHFVGENASAGLIDTLAAAFHQHLNDADQIATLLRMILDSDDFKSRWADGMRRPLAATVGALRALDADFALQPDNTSSWTTTEELFSRLQQTGQRPFRWKPPNGYPDSMQAWASTGALAMTLRLAARLPELRRDRSNSTSPRIADIVGQTKLALPDPNARTAGAITGYWCGRVLGWQPQPVSATVTAFLQQNAAANEALDLDSNSWDANNLKHHYVQSRLRTAVGMLLMNPDYLYR